MRRFALVLLALSLRIAPGTGSARAQEATIYRDEFGIPHVFGPTLEAAAYGVGYAQAEDRLEELLKNYRRAEGTMAEVFGPEHFPSDLTQRTWRHAAISRENYHKVSPKMRGVIEAYQEGIKRFMREHPDQVPAWAQKVEPWQVVALSRHIIWGWPLGEALGDLRRAGVELPPPAYRGSNEMLIAARRTAMNAPVAVIDPHLSWYDEFRFYEERIYGGDYATSGVAILGAPLSSLGHSRYCSVAMTTGGPDTADVYEEEVNPDNPRQYRHDGRWRDMEVRKETIGVKDGDVVKERQVEIESTRHGPVVARKANKAYAVSIAYQDEVRLSDQVYEMNRARNLVEMKQALGRLQLMAQNVMVGTIQGDIYYVRNGRVPVRAPGVDPSRPVPGAGSATDWRGIHPLADLVQIENPRGGWMQNCNVSPFAMMKEGAPTPDQFASHSYLYNAGATPGHQRAAMMNDLLDSATRVTTEQAIDIAFNPQVWHAERWQGRLKAAWSNPSGPGVSRNADAAQVARLIRNWDRRSDADSAGALAYYAFRKGLGADLAREVDPPADLSDAALIAALGKAADWLRANVSGVGAPFGDYFRVGRRGGARTWPVGGGSLRDEAMATPRAISFGPDPTGKRMVGRGGQTSTQVVILTDPPESYAVIPLGESDHVESGHWDDQAAQLFSKSRAAPAYFLRRDELLKHVTAKKVLRYEPARPAG